MENPEFAAALTVALATADSRELDQICDEYARTFLDERIEPPFRVTSADFAKDAYLICSDRYWNHRFRATPSVRTAAECAHWLHEHVDAEHRTEVLEKWALGYAFITRHSVESRTELAEASEDIIGADNSAGDLAYFTALYHAGKLRANFNHDELHRFLESSPLAMAAGSTHREDPLFVALQSLAAFGSDDVTNSRAIRLFHRAWSAEHRTRHVTDLCLNGLDNAAPFDEKGEMLRKYALEAVTGHPDDHMFHRRLASGHHLCGDEKQALYSIDAALVLLPTNGRVSHDLLQQQYMKMRDNIMEGMHRAEWAREQQERWDRQESENKALQDTLQSSTVRAVELVAVFTAAIAFAVGSLQVTLAGTLALGDRLWILAAFGGGLLLFALLIIAGTWFITRSRKR